MLSAPEHFASASSSRANGDYAGAAASYAAAIRLAPGMAEAYLNAGWVLSELERPMEAVAAYRHGLLHRQWPAETAAAAHNNLGVLMRDLGRVAEARVEWQAALTSKADYGPSLDNLAQASPTAATAVASAASSASTSASALTSTATPGKGFAELINAGNGLLSQEAYTDAAAAYRRAIPLRDPREDGSAYVGLGAALHASRRLSEAVSVLSAGAKLSPHSPGMLMNLAIVRTDLEQWKGAASAWRRALALRPNDAQAYRAAFAPVKRGKGAAAALPLLAVAARLDPTNWQNHYTSAHAFLHEAASPAATSASASSASASATSASASATSAAGGGRPRGGLGLNSEHFQSGLEALKPLHRQPISLRMRSVGGAEPPWTRERGRGLLGDEPPPIALESIWKAQAERRARSAAAGRQRGVIVYKLGPKASEVEHLRLSLQLLMRYHNRAFRYPSKQERAQNPGLAAACMSCSCSCSCGMQRPAFACTDESALTKYALTDLRRSSSRVGSPRRP